MPSQSTKDLRRTLAYMRLSALFYKLKDVVEFQKLHINIHIHIVIYLCCGEKKRSHKVRQSAKEYFFLNLEISKKLL